ncbi:MAG: hypothetical protein QXE79_05480, partial [Candidatus Bathyarchaeia archaeon]
QIFMSAVEIKGSTTTEKLTPPVNPTDLSKGCGFKAPGEADQGAPERWEVSSYLLTPGFVAVQQGDTVTLTVFVVNGDHHEVAVLAPDGQVVVPTATWQRGREYKISFGVEQVGVYIMPELGYYPDSIWASLFLISELDHPREVRDYFRSLPRLYFEKAKIPCPGSLKETVMTRLQDNLGEFHPESVNTIDGLRLEFTDGWLLIRPSGTEPVVRVIAESSSKQRAHSLVTKGKTLVQDIIRRLAP